MVTFGDDAISLSESAQVESNRSCSTERSENRAAIGTTRIIGHLDRPTMGPSAHRDCPGVTSDASDGPKQPIALITANVVPRLTSDRINQE
jgi:hypothetical protein